MKHYGDITKINGASVEPVDIITGGSPCQDLSVAGKRAGLAGERSGLFMEQIRIIKEIREHDIHSGRTAESVRPRYMVWENVPGAFSSNGGEDFRAVLEETARVVAKDAVIPGPPNGKWSYAGCILEDGWSIAWRTHDAQYWGVPQRRKRISLVADFGGQCAAEILFERESVSGNFEQGNKTKQGTSTRTDDGVDKTGGAKCFRKLAHPMNAEQGQGWEETETNDTLNCTDFSEGRTPTLVLENHPNDSRIKICKDNVFQTLSSRMGTGGNNVPMIYETQNAFIRRLTPKEVERLQGFPDDWTNIGDWIDSEGKLHKGGAESCRYRALGNSIALPFWQWMAGRMAKHLPENATMASLFDGIGGFPLVFSRSGVMPVWASEIEEFPIAVTKIRFKED